ncbi:hypothetical protein PR048_030834 [Dryococelus australis]|uniref:Uncharacterized protein n=1 Tax=Dryococelus australis TaxID=614101 RepID=A0ABQ9GCP6_9NEOP|nr:hypothetical protein PR048_030834 [Dryococelus australis]
MSEEEWRELGGSYLEALKADGVAVAERLACSPPTKANRVQSPAGSLPDFRMWESYQTMPLVSGFSRGSPVSSALSIRRCSTLTSIALIDSRNLAVKKPPKSLHSLHLRADESKASYTEVEFAIDNSLLDHSLDYSEPMSRLVRKQVASTILPGAGADSAAPRRNRRPTSPSPRPATMRSRPPDSPFWESRECRQWRDLLASQTSSRLLEFSIRLATTQECSGETGWRLSPPRRITRVGEDYGWWPKTLYILPQPSGRQSLTEAAWPSVRERSEVWTTTGDCGTTAGEVFVA